MNDEFEAKPGTAVHMPLLSEALINFAFNQAQEFVDSGQSVREATSICANLLLDAAWKVAGAGAAADGFDPNKDKFRARVEDVLERVSFSKMNDGEVSSDQPSANPETPPPSSHLEGIEEGIERAARYIEKQRDEYVQEYGMYDSTTGVTEFSNGGEEYLSTLEELIDGIWALATTKGSEG